MRLNKDINPDNTCIRNKGSHVGCLCCNAYQSYWPEDLRCVVVPRRGAGL